MHWKKYRVSTRVIMDDTFVFDKQLLVTVPGAGCETCCLETKECVGTPMCSGADDDGMVFQPASTESDLFLTLRLKGEI